VLAHVTDERAVRAALTTPSGLSATVAADS